MLRTSVENGPRMTPPAFLIILASPFFRPKAAKRSSVRRVSMQATIATFLSGYFVVSYFSYPFPSTNLALKSRISSIISSPT